MIITELEVNCISGLCDKASVALDSLGIRVDFGKIRNRGDVMKEWADPGGGKAAVSIDHNHMAAIFL